MLGQRAVLATGDKAIRPSFRHGSTGRRSGLPRGAAQREKPRAVLRNEPVLVLEGDVLALTERGTREIGDSDTSLPTAQLDLLVRVDGTLSVAEIAAGMSGVTIEAVAQGLAELARRGLVMPAPKADPDSLDFTNFFAVRDFGERGADARRTSMRQAAVGVASLKRHGYFVRIARRAAAGPSPAAGHRPVGVVIEDEPALAKLLKSYLLLEGYSVRVAGRRDEIVAALRAQPAPDMVLLDVMLPDADGFDILSRIRQHPSLKHTPVIMLTAKATREAVLRGLALGADGYITKPFELDVLIKAVETVLKRPET